MYGNDGCGRIEHVGLYALGALPQAEARALEAHLADCTDCRRELDSLRPSVDAFVSWPVDVVRPRASLWGRLAERIASETGDEPVPAPASDWVEPEWEDVAPGIACKLLATDDERNRVSMLVRLAPGVDYPAHRHAGVEELHLLDGELTVDDKKLHAGDYLRAEPGSADALVRSRTGCTCVLITSTEDELR